MKQGYVELANLITWSSYNQFIARHKFDSGNLNYEKKYMLIKESKRRR